jgi:hypothetical protein
VVDRETFKRIFREHWDGFRQEYPRFADEYYDKVIGKMLGCGDTVNGFMAYRCLHCGQLKRVAFSCKSSFCLSCAKVYTEEWVEYISRALFRGMKYRHVVLTMPEELRCWFRGDARLLSSLMKAGHAFYEDVVSYWLKEQVEVGSVVVLQTAGRSGGYNPHLHILCTSGGKREGEWKGFGYIDYKIMHRKWQYHLLRMLKEEVKTKEMAEAVDGCWRKYPRGFVAYIEKGEVPGGGKGLAYYLAKYVVSPPISLKRIVSYDGQKVRYGYNDHTTGQRVEEEVEAKVFIGRMVQHILPKGFQRVRYYGLQATCRASQVREEWLALLESEEQGEEIRDVYTVTGHGYRNRIKNSFGVDPLICCGQEMEFEGIWHPEYGWIVDNWKNFFKEEICLAVPSGSLREAEVDLFAGGEGKGLVSGYG